MERSPSARRLEYVFHPVAARSLLWTRLFVYVAPKGGAKEAGSPTKARHSMERTYQWLVGGCGRAQLVVLVGEVGD